MRRLFACHHCSHSQLIKEQVPATQINVAAEVSLGNSFDSRSGALPSTTYTRSTPLTRAIPTRSIARVLVSSVSSFPKRNVMAFASWIRCVLRPHLRVSICSHFRECFVQSGSVSILYQSPLCQCSLTCCGLTRHHSLSSPLPHTHCSNRSSAPRPQRQYRTLHGRSPAKQRGKSGGEVRRK